MINALRELRYKLHLGQSIRRRYVVLRFIVAEQTLVIWFGTAFKSPYSRFVLVCKFSHRA